MTQIPHRCYRCDQIFRSYRRLRDHSCPAYAIRGRMPMDEERQRYYRQNQNVRAPGRNR